MIIVLKQNAPAAQVQQFCAELRGMGFAINDSVGRDTHILGLIGDTKDLAESWVLANPVVETCRTMEIRLFTVKKVPWHMMPKKTTNPTRISWAVTFRSRFAALFQ